MKKLLTLLFFIIVIIFAGKFAMREQKEIVTINDNTIEVLLVCDGNRTNLGIEAFKSLLQEEGVPFSIIDNQKLISTKPQQIAKTKPALIYPDGSDGYIDQDTAFWMKRYISAGGSLLAVFDTGIKSIDGKYRLENGVLDELIGVRTNLYQSKREKSFINGPVIFSDNEAATFFAIPEGKRDSAGTLVGYKYGQLAYPYADNYLIDRNTTQVYAWGKREDGTRVPLIVRRTIGNGQILYVDLPLAYLKGNSDELLSRSVLKTFLFKIAKIPHLVSSPNAKGGLVINWHLDSNIELIVQPWFIANGYMDHRLKYSIHITAGPDCDAPGDGEGFDAAAKGKDIVEKLISFGTLGSHGGWAHNWFAKNLEEGEFSKEEILKLIEINNKTLSKITGYPIQEYSSPNGVFPQPLLANILEELGMTSYYYVGDSGSAPNRTFYNGRMVAKEIIAFPVMTFGKYASLAELGKAHYSKTKVGTLLKDIIDYTVRNRSVRLFYSHPYDIYEGIYKDEIKAFLHYAIKKQEEGVLTVETMSFFRDFLLKLIRTEKVFRREDGKVVLSVSNSKNLDDIVIAVPRTFGGYHLKKPEDVNITETQDWYYVHIDKGLKEFRVNFLMRKEGVKNEKQSK